MSFPESSAFTVDVRDLVGQPGSMQELHENVPTPADFGAGLVQVPEGSTMELDLRLESVHEGILVSGQASAEATGECGRCLDPLSMDLEVPVQELYLYEPDEVLDEDDEEQRLVVNDYVDLEPMLRDSFVSALPFQPVCREDCQGLCDQCGVRLDENPDHQHEVIDPRWAALSELGDLGKPESN
ncbi:YceD family protein [Micrococcoides hystricis]|uniref:DUF177 domain-containing protein n=1 Tax=Micrococcoides hystricis TaxID=1572761 RepID=A0ABV6PE57_9MICC